MARKVYIREVYFYVVCLISIVLFIVGIVTLADNITNYVKPTTYTTKASMLPGYKADGYYSNLSDEEINRMVEEELALQLKNEKLNALKSLIRGGVLLIIAIPLFTIHWTRAQAMWQSSANE